MIFVFWGIVGSLLEAELFNDFPKVHLEEVKLKPTAELFKVHIWRSDFFGQKVNRERTCGNLRCIWSSKGEHTADVRVYHYVQRPHPTPNLASPSVAMMLESEANYGLIAHFKQAGFDYSASTDPRSDFQRMAYPAKPYTPIKRANRIFGATFVARNCNRKRAAMVTKIASLIPVYSLSSCVPAGTIRRPMGSQKKITAISYYTHHLAFENSVCDGYVTEKIWDALKAG